MTKAEPTPAAAAAVTDEGAKKDRLISWLLFGGSFFTLLLTEKAARCSCS